MAAYRFCRSDDIGLLTDALNRCWSPHFPGEPAMTAVAFKQSIRERQVWCSSCMVAFAGADPIGVLIGAKRSSGTLVHKIAVHPDHRRQDHGRHLLTSLASKLAILGPPRTVAEVPEALVAACGLFAASGFVEEARLIDYVLPSHQGDACGGTASEALPDGRFVIPVSVDDLAANGLLEGQAEDTCWQRSVETLTARKDDIAGLAIASDERIEAYLLYVTHHASPSETGGANGEACGDVEIVSLRSCVEDGGERVRRLLAQLRARNRGTFRLPKVHPRELSHECLERLGFQPDGAHLLFAARAGSDPARAD